MRLTSIALMAIVLTVSFPSFALADDQPEQLKKMYQDALAQLKGAQDRKNELAMQNEQLSAKVAELTKQLDALRAETVELRARDSSQSEQTFFLRSHYAAWRSFVEQFPGLRTRWEAYLNGERFTATADFTGTLDPQWPLSMSGGN